MRKRKKAKGFSGPSEFYERLITIIGCVALVALVAVIVWQLVTFLVPRLTIIHRSYTEPLKEMPMLPQADGGMLAGLWRKDALRG
jgi:hypothetical protein